MDIQDNEDEVQQAEHEANDIFKHTYVDIIDVEQDDIKSKSHKTKNRKKTPPRLY